MKKWESLGTVQRAAALAQLTTSGCTLRGLADDLPCSEGLLRWYLQIAKLSEADKSKITVGESAKRVLSDSKEKKATLERFEQLRQQGAIDAISEQFKQLGIRWINEQELQGFYVELLLSEVDRRLWNIGGGNRTARQGNADLLWQSIQNSEPKDKKLSYGPDLLEYLIEWMIAWILLLAPERALRELVIQKLKRHAQRSVQRIFHRLWQRESLIPFLSTALAIRRRSCF